MSRHVQEWPWGPTPAGRTPVARRTGVRQPARVLPLHDAPSGTHTHTHVLSPSSFFSLLYLSVWGARVRDHLLTWAAGPPSTELYPRNARVELAKMRVVIVLRWDAAEKWRTESRVEFIRRVSEIRLFSFAYPIHISETFFWSLDPYYAAQTRAQGS